jgi:hypothetical protein
MRAIIDLNPAASPSLDITELGQFLEWDAPAISRMRSSVRDRGSRPRCLLI